jgi:hypothetical protein
MVFLSYTVFFIDMFHEAVKLVHLLAKMVVWGAELGECCSLRCIKMCFLAYGFGFKLSMTYHSIQRFREGQRWDCATGLPRDDASLTVVGNSEGSTRCNSHYSMSPKSSSDEHIDNSTFLFMSCFSSFLRSKWATYCKSHCLPMHSR